MRAPSCENVRAWYSPKVITLMMMLRTPGIKRNSKKGTTAITCYFKLGKQGGTFHEI